MLKYVYPQQQHRQSPPLTNFQRFLVFVKIPKNHVQDNHQILFLNKKLKYLISNEVIIITFKYLIINNL